MDWSQILNYVIMTLLGLLGGKPLIDWLKEKLGWEDLYVAILAAVVAVVVAVAELFLAGELSLEMFTLENFAIAWTAVYSASQAWYSVFKDRK